jgi:hypothetical protein
VILPFHDAARHARAGPDDRSVLKQLLKRIVSGQTTSSVREHYPRDPLARAGQYVDLSSAFKGKFRRIRIVFPADIRLPNAAGMLMREYS